ncbi:helix-turn-helix domain-containing protein [Glycomyces terrestris]|uniref:AraC family transcriptional regulator n=1 Tax=Glycomyces terrestris TaxID=2493553 RepID=A0A426UVZ6_9ACTN|nr:AraC family transcriptional regulator [Glycomyces terrestris]RRR98351.1 AraC family transcriptional regulator [Glycomyces terrestris]
MDTAPAYEERPAPAAARDWSPCLWVRRAPAAEAVRIVPDACTDLLWRAGRLEIAGPDTGPRATVLAPGEVIAGVRLRPGAARVLLGPVPATAVRDAQPLLADLHPGDAAGLAAAAAAETDPWRIAALLAAALAARPYGPDPVALAAARALDRARPPRLPVLARDLGFSERQLRRRVEDAAGYGPKTLEQVLRFRRATAAAGAEGRPAWARIAAETGYADQAHLSRQVRRWSGRPPTATPGPPTPAAS